MVAPLTRCACYTTVGAHCGGAKVTAQAFIESMTEGNGNKLARPNRINLDWESIDLIGTSHLIENDVRNLYTGL